SEDAEFRPLKSKPKTTKSGERGITSFFKTLGTKTLSKITSSSLELVASKSVIITAAIKPKPSPTSATTEISSSSPNSGDESQSEVSESPQHASNSDARSPTNLMASRVISDTKTNIKSTPAPAASRASSTPSKV